MFSRRTFLLSACGAVFSAAPFLTGIAHAGGSAFTAEAFEAAKSAGKPILIDITASWCPTCKAQAPIIESLSANPAYKDLVILEVDFDAQKDVVRSLGAQQQSTLITFKGGTEVDRSVGVTDPAAIEDMVKKALAGS